MMHHTPDPHFLLVLLFAIPAAVLLLVQFAYVCRDIRDDHDASIPRH